MGGGWGSEAVVEVVEVVGVVGEVWEIACEDGGAVLLCCFF